MPAKVCLLQWNLRFGSFRIILILNLSTKNQTQRISFRYSSGFLRRPQNLKCQIKWESSKLLWPFQNVWTLSTELLFIFEDFKWIDQVNPLNVFFCYNVSLKSVSVHIPSKAKFFKKNLKVSYKNLSLSSNSWDG